MLDKVGVLADNLRGICSLFDYVSYFFLSYSYQLFFNIARLNFLDAETIFNVISRIQLVVGVFMMFQLAMTVIKGIINPASFTDKKTGFGNVLMRIAVSLTLLAMLVPLNIPSPRNEYEKQINNNGILFGTLYSLQRRVLANNTIGRLIFGNDNTDYTSSSSDDESLFTTGNKFTTTVVKAFYVLNVDENGDFVCASEPEWEEVYEDTDTNYAKIIYMATAHCDSSGTASGILGIISQVGIATGHYEIAYPAAIAEYFTSEESYVVTMFPIVSAIAGFILAGIFVIMAYEVALRALKLAALQLMAPIPIISYMDPKGGKDGAFNSWVKLLTSTYLDLFIRLAVIYFAMDIITMLMAKMDDVIATMWSANDSVVVNIFIVHDTFVIIAISVLVFALKAPKFFKQMLGIKDDGGHFFSTLGDAIGIGATALGMAGSFASSRQASYDADEANAKIRALNRIKETNRRRVERGLKAFDEETMNRMAQEYATKYAHTGANRAKNMVAGIFGAGRGYAVGSAAASESKGNAFAKLMASRDAMHKSDLKVRDAGRNGSNLFSGIDSLMHETVSGQNAFDALDTRLKQREQEVKDKEFVLKKDKDILAFKKAIMDRVSSKALEHEKVVCDFDTSKLGLNYGKLGGSYRHWNSVTSAALSRGLETFDYEFVDSSGATQKVTIKTEDIKNIDLSMQDAAKESYYQQAITDSAFDGDVWDNKESYEKRANKKIEAKWGKEDGIKAKFGEENRRINNESAELNKQREEINRERQGLEAQKALYDSKFGRKS